jgi:ABC-type transport system substrate-binding protein
VKYDYDPRRAAQLIEGLGYVRRDGIFHDAAGQRLALDTRTNPGHEQRISAIGDYFRQVGIAAEPFIIPDARRTDREFNTTFPGVRLWRLPNEVGDISRLHSREAPLPENRFNGGNRSRYVNAEFDAMIDRYLATIPHPERVGILAQIIHHMTDQLPVMGIHYNTEPVMISKRLMNVTARDVGETTEAWNAHLWDVK